MKRIIIANSNNCRIFDYEKPGHLTFIKEINNPDRTLKNSELSSDKAGRYNAKAAIGGVFSQSSDMKDTHINTFARTLACELDKERNEHDYDRLVVIMPSQMEGLLCHHLNKNVKAMICHTVQKNIVKLQGKALLAYLNAHA